MQKQVWEVIIHEFNGRYLWMFLKEVTQMWIHLGAKQDNGLWAERVEVELKFKSWSRKQCLSTNSYFYVYQ